MLKKVEGAWIWIWKLIKKVYKKFFSSLPLCSVLPECGSSGLAWGSKKNKVLPRNKQESVKCQVEEDKESYNQTDEELLAKLEEEIETEEESEFVVEVTDIPDVILVREESDVENLKDAYPDFDNIQNQEKLDNIQSGNISQV